MTIPYFFWDFDYEKHGKVMEVLRRREEVTRKQFDEENGIIQEDASVQDTEEEKELEEVLS